MKHVTGLVGASALGLLVPAAAEEPAAKIGWRGHWRLETEVALDATREGVALKVQK